MKGGIFFPSSRTSYVEANTRKGKETYAFSTVGTHMRPSAQIGASGAQKLALGCVVHEGRHLAPNSPLTCA